MRANRSRSRSPQRNPTSPRNLNSGRFQKEYGNNYGRNNYQRRPSDQPKRFSDGAAGRFQVRRVTRDPRSSGFENNRNRTGGNQYQNRRVNRVDRNTTCPFLLPVYCREGAALSLLDFEDKAIDLSDLEIQIYAWKSATLREVTDLIKDVCTESRDRNVSLELSVVSQNRDGSRSIRPAGKVHSTRGGPEDKKTLEQLNFEIGEQLSLGIIKPVVRKARPKSEIEDEDFKADETNDVMNDENIPEDDADDADSPTKSENMSEEPKEGRMEDSVIEEEKTENITPYEEPKDEEKKEMQIEEPTS